jgi:hypothetical protein
MNTKNKVLIVSGLLIAVGGYYIYKNMKNKPTLAVAETSDSETQETPEKPVTPNSTTPVKPNSTKPDFKKVLSRGSKGIEVEILQKALKGGLVPDGDFGELTEKRLKAITGKTSISINEYNDFMTKKANPWDTFKYPWDTSKN